MILFVHHGKLRKAYTVMWLDFCACAIEGKRGPVAIVTKLDLRKSKMAAPVLTTKLPKIE